MFSHVMLGANDVETSKTFYDAALGALGARSAMVDPKGRAMYICLLYTSPSPRDKRQSRMPSSA